MTTPGYKNFDVRVRSVAGAYEASVTSPAGEAMHTFSLPFSDSDLSAAWGPQGVRREIMAMVEQKGVPSAWHKTFGEQLFECVFAGEVRDCLRGSLALVDGEGERLRIRLRLDQVPELAGLPWEVLFDPLSDSYLGLSTRTPIVRYLEMPQKVRDITVSPPLRVLVVIAGPSDYPSLEHEHEWSNLNKALNDLQQAGQLVLERLAAPTLKGLQRALRQDDYHILHFIGHGDVDPNTGSGLLLLEDEQGRGRAVRSDQLRTLLANETALRLIILNACKGAQGAHTNPFSGVAQSLVKAGVPAVVAMQFAITDGAAIEFSHEFYAALAEANYPVDAALTEARVALSLQPDGSEWATPVLFMRSPDGMLWKKDAPAEVPEHPKNPIDEAPPVADIGAVVTPRGAVDVSMSAAPSALETLLRAAEEEAALGQFAVAAQRAEAAYQLRLTGLGSAGPEELGRLFVLLVAGDSPQAQQVSLEGKNIGLNLVLSVKEAQALLRPLFVGRERELARLQRLAPGEWAWIQGGSGMGKTSLLRQLPGTHLPARSGLPYATLEAFLDVKETVSDELVLHKLRSFENTLLFDDWENMDPESRALLTRLRALRPPARVVITSGKPPPFMVELSPELGSLTKEDLAPYEGAWEATGGMPTLVGAYLQNEPLNEALEDRLRGLSRAAQDFCLSLASMEKPDPARVRQALDLDSPTTLRALRELISAGLVSISGEVGPRRAVQELIEARPTLLGTIGLRLARVLEGTEAFPLYQASRLYWTEEDYEGVQKAYVTWASELLRRGFPQRAADTLEESPYPDAPDAAFLKARALSRTGRYRDALKTVLKLEETPGVLALKGDLFYRLGQAVEARQAAERALEGDVEARAGGENVLGNLDLATGAYEAAAEHYERAAALWQLLGYESRQVYALSNRAITLFHMDKDAEAAFEDALRAAEGNPMVRITVLNNLAVVYRSQGKYDLAERSCQAVIDVAQEIGVVKELAYAWSNLGTIYEDQQRVAEAELAYTRALELARQAGDAKIIGDALANQAALTSNVAALEEAYRILKSAGLKVDAQEVRELLPEGHPLRQQQ